MARGSQASNTASTQGNANAVQGSNAANNFYGQSTAAYQTVLPQLESQIANPAGYTPNDLAAANTAAQQSAGGSQAAAIGQGALLAARNRNAGSPATAIAEGVRSAGENLSKEAVGTQLANAGLKERQRESALSGMENLVGTTGQLGNGALGASNTGLGEVASNVNANTNAVNASYDPFSMVIDPLLGAAGSASPTIGKAFGL